MKHLLFSYHTCPLEEPGTGLAGGMNIFLRGLLSGLSRKGIETDVLTRGKGERVTTTRPFRGVRVYHLPCGWKEPASREGALRALPRFMETAGEFLRTRRTPPDALSAHYWMSGVAARVRSRGMVFAFHTVEARKPMPAGYRPDALSLARREAEERIAREAYRVVFLSDHDLVHTTGILPEVAGKGMVIPPGVDDSFRSPPSREESRRAFGISPGAFLFLLAARPEAGKNTLAAVEALSAIRGGTDRETFLLIAGQNPPAGGVPAGVVFTGPVPHAKMPGLLSAADAVLSPSTYESFGLVPLEAMAAGVPVIVPRDGHWGDTVAGEGGGMAYFPDSPRGLADAMAEMMGDAAARDRMSGEGKRIAARFTWERCTDSWARLLSSAARRDNRR